MSASSAASISSAPAAPALAGCSLPLGIGVAGLAVAAAGFVIDGPQAAAAGWLTALVFWVGIAVGILFLIMLGYIFDAGWSVVLRRQLEHLVSVFKWLAVLFVPLLVLAWAKPGLLWHWMDPNFDLSTIGGHGTVGTDVLYGKKSGFLSLGFFTVRTVAYFGIWIGLAAIFRRNSFSQDADGEAKWTLSSRKWAAAGLALTAVSSTFAAIDWVKSLDYHWFSTMYGVWYFSNGMRGALSVLALVCIVGLARGTFTGVVNRTHLYDVGKLMLAFTVFWAYITFSQYFLIWNANIPEETFWYNLREILHDGSPSQWKWVGLAILFGYFLVPFLYLLSYKVKTAPKLLAPVAVWILVLSLLDVCYNVLPFRKDAAGDPLPFLSSHLIWTIAAVIGVGGICVWSYLRSFPTAKLIPIRDPRIRESLGHRE
ncbi:MAG TPA: hypothetical protein PK322_04810 [Opitutaceae bacterium]|nr:hypothetical protein [Opitutaceae bacterium]